MRYSLPPNIDGQIDCDNGRSASGLASAEAAQFMLTAKPLLLVEDEGLIALALEDQLTESGYAVRHAADGVSALEALENNSDGFCALVTDIRLPHSGPDGFALAQRARELSPSIVVVFMSGDAAIEWASKGVPKSVMLQKPFAIAQLVTAVSTLLNDASSPL